MKIVFMGTAAFAVPSLEALKQAGHEIALVVAQPDRASGRGMRLKSPPLKEAASKLGLEVFQPEKIKETASLEKIRSLEPDYLCVVAYGQILPQSLLDVPKRMALNLHASLLPKYRGAAPIEWAVANGEIETGVCVQKMALKMDAGPVLLSQATAIGADETAAELTERLSPMGADLLMRAVGGEGSLLNQVEASATYAPLLKKHDGAADFGMDARAFYARFRGFGGRPGFYVGLGAESLRVHDMRLQQGSGKPGELLELGEEGLKVACGSGAVLLRELQAAGARRLGAMEFARGKRLGKGALFSAPKL